MAISSTGVGSGLDVKSIVSQLVAIEKKPLETLQTKATNFKSQLSLYGTVKSQVSALGDAAAVLASANGWNAQKAHSSSAAVSVSAGAAAKSVALSVEVERLALAQTAASASLAANPAGLGASGVLNIEFGSWSDAATPVFGAPVSSISVTIAAADKLSDIASKINAASSNVTATVLKDGPNERLVIRSKNTGADAGFRLDTPADPGLSVLGFTNPDKLVTELSPAAFSGQAPVNAKIKVNGVSIESATNNIVDVTPGVNLQLNQKTTSPAEITVANDPDAIQKNIENFVEAYNALNKTLADATKYMAATKVAGPLQGDSTTVGLQNTLRAILGSSTTGATIAGTTSPRLSDVGIERQTDGSLKINATKLTSAKQDMANLEALFSKKDDADSKNSGFGLKIRDFSRGLLAFDGAIANKSKAIEGSLNRNADDQDRVTARAARVEAQLYRQYSALDAQMATLNGLSSYVNAQLAQWNKPTQ
jgi:flagellar hook-associated protein 2